MDSQKGREIHGLAESAREHEQNFLKALKLLEEASLEYQKDQDYLGLAEAQSSRFITLKHLYRTTQDNVYLILALQAAISSVEISKLSGINSASTLPYFNLGKAYLEQENWSLAAENLKIANESELPNIHNRTAVKADIKAHYAFALYQNGDKSGLSVMNQAIEELAKSTEENIYNKDVWLSGAHMRTAFMLRADDPQVAREHLEKARVIIEKNEDLKLRKEEITKLANLINYPETETKRHS